MVKGDNIRETCFNPDDDNKDENGGGSVEFVESDEGVDVSNSLKNKDKQSDVLKLSSRNEKMI